MCCRTFEMARADGAAQASDRASSEGWRENVLHGVTRRHQLPPGVPPPNGPPRLVNVTFRVDDISLNWARGRAVVEGTSVSALVNRLLEEYSGIARPPGQPISRRIPMFRERRIRPHPEDPPT
jgi:hypothetical protein